MKHTDNMNSCLDDFGSDPIDYQYNQQDCLFGDTNNMTPDWTPNPDELLNNIFDLQSDFFDNIDDNNFNLCDVNALSEELAEVGNSINDAVLQKIKYEEPVTISSSNSDSGLSSDNVDVEMSPEYEPLSPALSSPGPSVSERGVQNSPPHLPTERVYNVPNIKKNNTRNPQSIDSNMTKPIILKAKPNEVKLYKISPSQITNGTLIPHTTGKKVTIQLQKSNDLKLNSSGGLKTITKPKQVLLNRGQTQNYLGSGIQKIIRVQHTGGAQSKQVLLPVCIQDVKDVRKIKIINRNTMKQKQNGWTTSNLMQNNTKVTNGTKKYVVSKEHIIVDDSHSDTVSDSDSYIFDEFMQTNDSIDQNESVVESIEYDDDDDDMLDDDESSRPHTNGYPRLVLTAEENRLLIKEGITLPSHYPLTKNEERELKRIRRKIRNKISAQDSRKRKKEYVDGLEERVKKCTAENQNLMKRINLLQKQNHNLMHQMKKLQTMLARGSSKTAQPATCLMVLLLSLALVAVPNLKLGKNISEKDLANVMEETMMLQNRRNLLFDTKEQLSEAVVDEEINFDDILSFDDAKDHDYINEMSMDGNENIDSFIPPKKARSLIDFDVDDKIWRPPKDVGILKHDIESEKIIQSSGFNIVNKTATDPIDGKLDIQQEILNGLADLKSVGNELNDKFDTLDRVELNI